MNFPEPSAETYNSQEAIRETFVHRIRLEIPTLAGTEYTCLLRGVTKDVAEEGRKGGQAAGGLPVTGSPAAPIYILVCRGPTCRERGGLALRRALTLLLRGQTDVLLAGYACFGQCESGPNVLFYPEGRWAGGLTSVGDAQRVVAHAHGELPLDDAPLALPPADREEHLRNAAELVATLESDRQRRSLRRRWWPF